jgi:hypothetical protein
MGQYYKVIILGDNKKNNKEIILLVIHPHNYDTSSKLMEHSYHNTKLMNTVEYLVSVNGPFYKSRIIWAGDYAGPEEGYNNDDEGVPNLYNLANNYSNYTTSTNSNNNNNKYILNHTKKLYVDKYKTTNEIHQLPLLVSDGNGSGGGDYLGYNQELCGTWARDVISIGETYPEDYTELVCDFS